MRRPILMLALVAALAFGTGVAACSDDTEQRVEDALDSARDDFETRTSELREDLERHADEAAARVAAEALRAGVKVEARDDDLRSLDAIDETADRLPDEVTVAGVDDSDGDGLDDDGKVTVTVGDASACVTFPAEGTDTTVESGTCAA